jgi:8-oxo-dGTP pyrophosphatase MutT (NUDIX family)
MNDLEYSTQVLENYTVSETELYDLTRRKLEDHDHTVYKYAEVPYRHAAVLIPLFFKDGRAHMLFTKRTDKVEHHKGQISFPGGVKDASDEDMLETALRETWEEMGIAGSDITILGKTDTFLTNTNYLVTPYVGYYPYPYEYKINRDEISQVLEVPLLHLLDPEIFTRKLIERGGHTWDVHFYAYGQESIWGVTGFLLSNFLSIVFDLQRMS